MREITGDRHISSLPSQSCGPKVYTKACAPDRNRAIFIQVGVGGNVVILVADVALYAAEIDETRLFDQVIALLRRRRDQIDMDVGTIDSEGISANASNQINVICSSNPQ